MSLINLIEKNATKDRLIRHIYQYPDSCLEVSRTSNDNTTPLHLLARKYYDIEVFQAILETRPTAYYTRNNRGWLPVHIAIQFNVLEVIEYLVNFDISYINQYKIYSSISCNILHFTASFSLYNATFKLLLNYFSHCCGESNNHGDLPIHLALRNEHFSSYIWTYIKLFPETFRCKNNHGRLPLHEAMFNQSSEVINAVIDIYPEAIMIPDDNGELPIHIFVLSRNAEAHVNVLKHMLQYNQDICKKWNHRGQLPIHKLCDRYFDSSSVEILLLLLQAYPESIKMKCLMKNYLPLHYLCDNNFTSIDMIKIVLYLYPYGLCTRDTFGNMPIHLSVINLIRHKNVIDEVLRDERLYNLLCNYAHGMIEIFFPYTEHSINYLSDGKWNEIHESILYQQIQHISELQSYDIKFIRKTIQKMHNPRQLSDMKLWLMDIEPNQSLETFYSGPGYQILPYIGTSLYHRGISEKFQRLMYNTVQAYSHPNLFQSSIYLEYYKRLNWKYRRGAIVIYKYLSDLYLTASQCEDNSNIKHIDIILPPRGHSRPIYLRYRNAMQHIRVYLSHLSQRLRQRLTVSRPSEELEYHKLPEPAESLSLLSHEVLQSMEDHSVNQTVKKKDVLVDIMIRLVALEYNSKYEIKQGTLRHIFEYV